MMISESENSLTSVLFTFDEHSQKIMKQNFKYWNENYRDSLINYPLVWKKVIESNFEIKKRIEDWQNHSNQNVEIILEQFLEIWSYAIRETDFNSAIKSINNWPEFWKTMTDEQFRKYNEIFQMIEQYWTNLQSKNIE